MKKYLFYRAADKIKCKLILSCLNKTLKDKNILSTKIYYIATCFSGLINYFKEVNK